MSTIVLMTIERYLVIINPLNSMKISIFQIKLTIVFTWIYSSTWVLLELVSPNGFILEGFLTHCTFDYLSRDLFTRTLMILMFFGGFFAPLLTISVLNLLIWKKLKSTKYNLVIRPCIKPIIQISSEHFLNSTSKSMRRVSSVKMLRQKQIELSQLKSNLRKRDVKLI